MDTRGAMPLGNRDLVQQIYDEFNETLELPRWLLDAEMEWWPPADEPDNDVRRGAEDAIVYVREWAGSFEDYRCEVLELVESSDHVAASLVLHGRIPESTGELTLPLTQVWRIRDGRIVEVREYRTLAEAVAELALKS
jgi:ketosteroid isomerase-like protein